MPAAPTPAAPTAATLPAPTETTTTAHTWAWDTPFGTCTATAYTHTAWTGPTPDGEHAP